jgi:hypothetical protein
VGAWRLGRAERSARVWPDLALACLFARAGRLTSGAVDGDGTVRAVSACGHLRPQASHIQSSNASHIAPKPSTRLGQSSVGDATPRMTGTTVAEPHRGHLGLDIS